MPDDDKIDYQLAQHELREAMRSLSELTGQPLPEQPAPKSPFCSFCGKGVNEVQRMVAGPAVYICNECVSTVQKIMDEK